MGADPDQLRRDVEYTRARMSTDVDALSEKVSPKAIVHRRAQRAKGSFGRIKERVMGTASDGISTASHGMSSAASGVSGAASGVGGAASSAASGVSDAASSAASSVGDAATSTAQTVRRQAEGNPLAAGLIAFGVGWLVSSLLPTTEKEHQGAEAVLQTVQEKAQPVVRQAASELKDNLREPAQHAVESVRSTATDAASTMQEQARSSAQDVAHQAKDAGQTVREQARH
jgi:Protein of unknown function (DUF3618)